MNSRQRRTLQQVFQEPTTSDLRWHDVASLFGALGASMAEAAGSRVTVRLNGVMLTLHRPHPRPELKKSAVRAVADFLTNAGVEP